MTGSLWQFYRDEPAFDDNDVIMDFPANNNNSKIFKFKQKIPEKTNNNVIKNVEIIVLLKYLNNSCRILEMPLINCEISLTLTWSKNCFLITGT